MFKHDTMEKYFADQKAAAEAKAKEKGEPEGFSFFIPQQRTPGRVLQLRPRSVV